MMKKAKQLRKKPSVDSVPSGPESTQSDLESNSLWREPFVHVLLILAAGFIVYGNSISVPFMFDDYVYLINNPAIKSFSSFPDTQGVLGFGIATDIKNNVILRPVSYFTFAVNYAIHGLD